MIRYHFVFTQHAKRRCVQRNINTALLRRQLHTIPFNRNTNKLIRWDIPETNLYVVFIDRNYNRVIITVSYRYINKLDSDGLKQNP